MIRPIALYGTPRPPVSFEPAGGAVFKYEISGADLPRPTTVALYWSTTPKFDPKTSILAHSQETETKVGEYGPFPIPDAELTGVFAGADRPEEMKYLLLVADPQGGIVEGSELNNEQSLELKTETYPLRYQAPDYTRARSSVDISGDDPPANDWFYGEWVRDDEGNRVEMWVIDTDGRDNAGTPADPYDEYYAVIYNGKYLIGVCPYEGGDNKGVYSYWSRAGVPVDGIYRVRWRSIDGWIDDVGTAIWPGMRSTWLTDYIDFDYRVPEDLLKVKHFDFLGSVTDSKAGPAAVPGGSWFFNGQHVPEPVYSGEPMTGGTGEFDDPWIISLLASPPAVVEGGTIEIASQIINPASASVHQATIDWGDGTTEVMGLTGGHNSIAASHQYLDNGTDGATNGGWIIQVRVTGDFGDTDVESTPVKVYNSIPTLDAGPDVSIVQGGTLHALARLLISEPTPGQEPSTTETAWAPGR